MGRSPSFAGVILAAGDSTRMGQDKALLPWKGGTFLSAAIDMLKPVTELVIVVGGKNTNSLLPTIYQKGAFLTENHHTERGQFSSLKIGLQEVLNRGRDTAMVALVDRYLKDRELPISEIAWLLGYREISSFTHAFKRWTGMNPREFRSSAP